MNKLSILAVFSLVMAVTSCSPSQPKAASAVEEAPAVEAPAAEAAEEAVEETAPAEEAKETAEEAVEDTQYLGPKKATGEVAGLAQLVDIINNESGLFQGEEGSIVGSWEIHDKDADVLKNRTIAISVEIRNKHKDEYTFVRIIPDVFDPDMTIAGMIIRDKKLVAIEAEGSWITGDGTIRLEPEDKMYQDILGEALEVTSTRFAEYAYKPVSVLVREVQDRIKDK